MGLSHLAFRILGDRMKVQGQPLLMLNTVGARSGEKRQTMLGRFDDPGRPGSWLVVGSGAGSARHPSWCHNLVKNPNEVSVTIGKQVISVDPESLEGVERGAAWNRVVSRAPGYGKYEETTDRQIPIIRLTPKGSGR